MTIKRLKENYTQHLRQLFIAWWILRGCFSGLAQTTIPNHFLVYKMSNGLPGNIIYGIATDADGFVWVSTNHGIARYDGQRFVLTRDINGLSTIPQTLRSVVFADSHNHLWVGVYNEGIYCIDLKTYKVRFINKDYIDINMGFNPSFTEDKEGNVWFYNSKGLIKWQHKESKFSFFDFSEHFNNRILRICNSGQGFLWVGTSGGVYRFDAEKNIYEREQGLNNLDSRTAALATDDSGNLWLSNWYSKESGIVCYDPNQRQILHKINKQMIAPNASTDAHDIIPLGKIILIATNSSGLITFDTESKGFNMYLPEPKNPLSIQSETAICAKKDKQGNLWVGTTNGLHLQQAHRKEVVSLVHNPFISNSLISNLGTSVFNLDDRKVILGTLSGMSIYDRMDKTFKNINLPLYNGNNYNNNINAIAAGEVGSFWVGTWSGLFRLDKNSGSILEYYITFRNAGENHPESVKRMDIHAIKELLRDKKDNVWFINQDLKLGKMTGTPSNRSFEISETLMQDNDDKNDLSNCLLEWGGYLYIGTENGLVQYDYNTQSFQLLPIAFREEKDNISITSLESSNGFLMAIVNGKPYTINVSKQEAVPLLILKSNEKYTKIIQDTEGGIWLLTENGILRTNSTGSSSFFYDSKHYLSDNTFQWGGEYRIDKDADGNLYFGGSKGFTVIQPQKMQYHAPQPDVKITSIKYNNQPIELGEAIHLISAISLPYAQRSFTLEFTALGSSIPALNQFAYRFNDGQWVNLGYQSNVNFSNLEPGTYHLQVKAANSDGIWNEEGARLTITIQPPWYRSWLAWLVYLGALSYGIYQYYLYQLKRRMEQSETQRLKELDTIKTRFYANVSHELRTPLTLLLAPLSTVLKNGKLDNRDFTLVRLARQNAQSLLKLVNEILDLNKLEAKKLELKEEKTVVYNLIRRIAAGFESAAEVQHIHFIFDYRADSYLQLSLDTNKFEKILNNLLSNACKFTKANGTITLTVTEEQITLKISVADTGRGIHPDDLPHIFNRFYQSNQADALTEGGTGIGLSLSMELAKLMGGQLTVQSTLGEGSVFTFDLPKKEVLGTVTDAAEIINNQNSAIEEEHLDMQLTPSVFLPKTIENGERKTVLIVEDNQSLRDYLTLILEPYYTVLKAENGQVALTILEKGVNPNLILSDVMMPMMDGFQLLSYLKTNPTFSLIPVVMLTARAELQDKLKALRIGVDDYLIKPFEEEELLVRIENLLKNAQNREVMQQENLSVTTLEATETDNPTSDTLSPPLSIDDLKWLSELENMVRDNISDYNLSTDRMAEMLFVSRAQFYRRVRMLTGLTPIEYLQEVRFNHARYLLEQRTVSSVKAAAAAVGMRQVQNFSQHFKERFGKSPSEYLS
ncbi:MAG: response regulator [Saprospiraceae bacterium]|nr:response regulator [Saprospiraceae bacterium]